MSANVVLPLDSKWGYDPWLGPGTPVATMEEFLASVKLSSTKVFTGEDTIGSDIGLLNAGLNLYGSYIDNFGGFPALVARMGHTNAFLLSFTIFGGHALCADLEPGAMRNNDLKKGGWPETHAIKDASGNFWVYTNAGNLSAVKALLSRFTNVIYFSAHYGHGPHICGPHTCGFPQAHWTQWDDKGPTGQNVDRSVGTYLPQAPAPPQPAGGTWAFAGTFDPVHDHFTIAGTPGKNVKFAAKKRVAKFTGTVNEQTGSWTVRKAGVLTSLLVRETPER